MIALSCILVTVPEKFGNQNLSTVVTFDSENITSLSIEVMVCVMMVCGQYSLNKDNRLRARL